MNLPHGLTRMQHYAQLPRARCGTGRAWTMYSAIVALALFVREEGRFPDATHLHAHEGLPSHGTMIALFRSYARWKQAYLDACPAHEASARPSPQPYARLVTCLRCERLWQSPDARQRRLCRACRPAEIDDDGLWMNNTPVLCGSLDEEDFIEEV